MPLVLITGSGRRLGKGLALEFAGKGWDIAVHYNDSQSKAVETMRLIESFGCRSIAVRADLQNYGEIKEAFFEVFEKLGIPDVLVNNAGVFPAPLPLSEINGVDWDYAMNINARSQLFTSKIYASVAKKNARIINFASLGGMEIWKKRIPYNVSKAASIQLTKALARELAPDIQVNCICPGAILIPEDSSQNERYLLEVNKIPMKRYGTVKDVFDAVYFFSTCSTYITGQIINIDGGSHISK